MTSTLPRPDDALLAPPTGLPPVERRAAIPGGFLAGGATVGIKASGRPDLAVVTTLRGPDGRLPAAAAAVFTPNAMAAAPVRLSRANLAATAPEGDGRWGWASGLVSTSGSANAATGAAGDADQRAILAALAAAIGSDPDRTLAMSTGHHRHAAAARPGPAGHRPHRRRRARGRPMPASRRRRSRCARPTRGRRSRRRRSSSRRPTGGAGRRSASRASPRASG